MWSRQPKHLRCFCFVIQDHLSYSEQKKRLLWKLLQVWGIRPFPCQMPDGPEILNAISAFSDVQMSPEQLERSGPVDAALNDQLAKVSDDWKSAFQNRTCAYP